MKVSAQYGVAVAPRNNASTTPTPLASLKAASSTLAVYDPSDLSTMWQDRAGTTTQAVAGQPVGYVKNMKTGASALHLVAATDGQRPVATNGLLFDGTDDGLRDAATAGLPASATLLALVKSADATGIVWSNGVAAFIGAWDGTGGAVHSGAGTPTVKVDGVAKATRLALQTALADALAHTVLIEAANLSAWGTFGIGTYNGGGFPVAGNLIPVWVGDSAGGDYAATLTLAQTYATTLRTSLAL